MRLAQTIRLIWLEAKATAATLGLLPVVVGWLFVLAAFLQEPTIFRSEGLELAWPSIYAVSDTLFLVVFWNRFTLSHGRSLGGVAATLGSWVVGAAICLALTAADPIYGGTERLEVAAQRGGHLVLRAALVWLPVAFLTHTAWLQRQATLARFVVVLVAYLMQASLVPASLDTVGPNAVLALAICPVIALVASSSKAPRDRASPTNVDADRNPR